jgi:hypothetical protein
MDDSNERKRNLMIVYGKATPCCPTSVVLLPESKEYPTAKVAAD